MNAVIFGANSTIATEFINLLAIRGYNLYLLGRNLNSLSVMEIDLKARYPNIKIKIYSFDAEIENEIQEKIKIIKNDAKQIDILLVAHGQLPDNKMCSEDWNTFNNSLLVNGIKVIEICHQVALIMKLQKNGIIVAISSVAGLRGRQSNYAYGTAKGMLNIYLQGLRNEMYNYNVKVLTVLPGFVDTKMTLEFEKGILWATPQRVANDIFKAIDKNKDIVYTPWFWRHIMMIINIIPEFLFKKMKL